MRRTRTAAGPNRTATIDSASALSLSGMDLMKGIASGELPVPPFARLLGFEVENVEEGKVTFVLEPAESHYNPFGVVHGGVAATLFDSALGCSIQTLLPPGQAAPTMELHINYIRPITISTGRIRCSGRVVHLGKRSAIAEGRLVDMDGKLYAHATGTFVISPLKKTRAG